MDYIHKVFMNFLKLESVGGMDFKWTDNNLSSFIKNIFICGLKIAKNRMGLEQHEGELLMTECFVFCIL